MAHSFSLISEHIAINHILPKTRLFGLHLCFKLYGFSFKCIDVTGSLGLLTCYPRIHGVQKKTETHANSIAGCQSSLSGCQIPFLLHNETLEQDTSGSDLR